MTSQIWRGSAYKQYAAAWEYIYAARAANFGTTLTMIPLCDPAEGAINGTTNTTRAESGGSAQTLTWAVAPSAMATGLKLEPRASLWNEARLHGPAGIPLVLFDGTTDRATIPDATYWTQALAAQSFVGCGYFVGTTGVQVIIAKDNGGSAQEWSVHLTAAELLTFRQYDQTAGFNISRASDAAVPLSVPIHFAVTMDTGATMANAVIYINGSSVASTASNTGAFVTVQNTAAVVSVGSNSAATPANYLNGSGLYGGPWGLGHMQAQATATQILKDFKLWRGTMGLG